MRFTWLYIALLCVAAAAAATSDADRTFMKLMTMSMERMNHGMTEAPMTGNIDHDFATMMISHHEGAIDMAKAELSFGKDPVMRRLAQETSLTSNRKSKP